MGIAAVLVDGNGGACIGRQALLSKSLVDVLPDLILIDPRGQAVAYEFKGLLDDLAHLCRCPLVAVQLARAPPHGYVLGQVPRGYDLTPEAPDQLYRSGIHFRDPGQLSPGRVLHGHPPHSREQGLQVPDHAIPAVKHPGPKARGLHPARIYVVGQEGRLPFSGDEIEAGPGHIGQGPGDPGQGGVHTPVIVYKPGVDVAPGQELLGVLHRCHRHLLKCRPRHATSKIVRETGESRSSEAGDAV